MQSGFTEKAELALQYAAEAAFELRHNNIGSEHILLGLLSDSKMVSATILGVKKISFKKAEEQTK